MSEYDEMCRKVSNVTSLESALEEFSGVGVPPRECDAVRKEVLRALRGSPSVVLSLGRELSVRISSTRDTVFLEAVDNVCQKTPGIH